jgi:hypothetical protein
MVGLTGTGAEMQICTTAVASLSSGLQGPCLRCPWAKKRGRVRFLGLIAVHSCRRKRQRGSRVAAKISSSLHIEIFGWLAPPLLQGKGLCWGLLES